MNYFKFVSGVLELEHYINNYKKKIAKGYWYKKKLSLSIKIIYIVYV